jgi:hypothetical protein
VGRSGRFKYKEIAPDLEELVFDCHPKRALIIGPECRVLETQAVGEHGSRRLQSSHWIKRLGLLESTKKTKKLC